MRAAVWVVLAACGGGGSGGDDGPTDFASGPQMPVGGGAATDGHALVLFATDDLEPYKWGDGLATGTSFSVDVTDPVPMEALLIGSGETTFFGLGQVYLVPSGVDFPDGVISSDANLNDQIIGIAGDYAIIYRPSDQPFTD